MYFGAWSVPSFRDRQEDGAHEKFVSNPACMRHLGKSRELDEHLNDQLKAMLDAGSDRLCRIVDRVLARHGVEAHESQKRAPARVEPPASGVTSVSGRAASLNRSESRSGSRAGQ